MISETRKEYLRNYQRVWVAKRRAHFFADKVCVRCGTSEKLELDHIDPKQKVNHRIWSWSKERQALEIAKCQVLCKRCHLAKTITLDCTRAVHGGHSMYWDCKCRCDECLAWKAKDDKRPR